MHKILHTYRPTYIPGWMFAIRKDGGRVGGMRLVRLVRIVVSRTVGITSV